MRMLFLCLITFFPFSVFAAEEAAFLRPAISEVNRSTVCSVPTSCEAVFLIKGRNFENANGVADVKIGDDWANVVKRTPTSLVAVTAVENLNRQPAVTIDTTLHRPELISSDPVINELFQESVQVAIDSIRISDDGTRYITAGPFYSAPERAYYRDTYWSSGMILLMEPSVIRDQILLLTRGVLPDGSVPSAVTINPNDIQNPLWTDHYDSGSYLVMLVRDYLSWTGDLSILSERVNDKTVFTTLEDVLTTLASKDTNQNLLIDKPSQRALNDWADSIPRPGEVLYNQALYYKALRDMVDIATVNKQAAHAKAFHRHSLLLRYRINERFWDAKNNVYRERCDANGCIDRITAESAVAALYDVVDPSNKQAFLDSLLQLESRKNSGIAYGDWGVSNVFPFYEGTRAYTYQNGTDWPFLDGINSGARLKAGDTNWYYPMTQWWIWWKASGRPGVLPEFVSPVDKGSGLSQAWSSNPMFSLVRYGLGFDPDINGMFTFKPSPIKDVDIKNFSIRGKRLTKTIND